MKYKAVIFDLDGTLLNTLEDLADSMNSVLENMDFPLHSLSEYKVLVGRGMRNLVTYSLPAEQRSDDIIDRCYAEMFETYGKRWNIKTLPYDGIPELLDRLTEKKIKLAVLSNKIDRLTQMVVQEYLSKWHFEAVFGERPGVPRKPDPAALFEIQQILRINPDNILCLGDSGSDMEAARKAGMFPAGALWGFRDADELLSNGAELLISRPDELLRIF